MSINNDPEVFKLLSGIIGVLAIGIGSVFLKLFFGLKDTINIIFGRLNGLDHKVTEREAVCKERHESKK